MKLRIAVPALLAMAAFAGGCGSECDSDEEGVLLSPTLIVVNNGDLESAILDLTYEHDGLQSHREVTLAPGKRFAQAYPELGTLRLAAGRLRDGFLLIQGTFGINDFINGFLTIDLRP
jgi:hypothetical protein